MAKTSPLAIGLLAVAGIAVAVAVTSSSSSDGNGPAAPRKSRGAFNAPGAAAMRAAPRPFVRSDGSSGIGAGSPGTGSSSSGTSSTSNEDPLAMLQQAETFVSGLVDQFTRDPA